MIQGNSRIFENTKRLSTTMVDIEIKICFILNRQLIQFEVSMFI